VVERDAEKAAELEQLLYRLMHVNGNAVEIAPQAQFSDAVKSQVIVRNEFRHTVDHFYGDSMLDCLEQAVQLIPLSD